MMESSLYPHLPLNAARARLAMVLGKGVEELGRLASYDAVEMAYPPTGGVPVKRESVAALRESLLEAARRLGFPGTRRHESLSAFDAKAGEILLGQMSIRPGEAGRNEVWSFITLVLLPDLATWRFADQNEKRFLGGPRNTFQRMWWRAYMLHDMESAEPFHLLKLPEDALVGLMERPGISSNRLVSLAIGNSIAGLIEALPAGAREDAWRDAYKRIRQRFPIVALSALPAEQISQQMKSLCTEAVDRFRTRS